MITTQKGPSLARTKMEYTLGKTRQASATETDLGLKAKLLEECGEILKAPGDVSEYADVLQVLMDMCKINNVEWVSVVITLQDKAKDKGTFLDKDNQALLWEPLDG